MIVIKQITALIRRVVWFPLFQLLVVVAVILLLQGADERSAPGLIFTGLDKLVAATVQWISEIFTVRSFTRSWLVSGFMIAYVYLACLLILALLRLVIRSVVDMLGQHNVLGLRHAIARERGIAAYRAWEPLERIRPADVPQHAWETTYAWPADNRPPYPPLAQRIALSVVSNLLVIVGVLVLIQYFTPFPVLTWLGQMTTGWLR